MKQIGYLAVLLCVLGVGMPAAVHASGAAGGGGAIFLPAWKVMAMGISKVWQRCSLIASPRNHLIWSPLLFLSAPRCWAANWGRCR